MDTYDSMMTVDEVSRFLKISRNHTYDMVKTGQIPSIRLGKTIRVARSQLLATMFDNAERDSGSNVPVAEWAAFDERN